MDLKTGVFVSCQAREWDSFDDDKGVERPGGRAIDIYLLEPATGKVDKLTSLKEAHDSVRDEVSGLGMGEMVMVEGTSSRFGFKVGRIYPHPSPAAKPAAAKPST